MAYEEATGADVGLSGDRQIRVALQSMVEGGGAAEMRAIYDAVEKEMGETRLSDQGKASLRFFVNKVAKEAGYVYPHDNPEDRGTWRITPEGREYIRAGDAPPEVVLNLDTGKDETIESNSVRGEAFERYLLPLLQRLYPHYAWFRQGERKASERGLDFIGTRVGEFDKDQPFGIGVQVKFHQRNVAPNQTEWLKFLAGCHARQVERTMFITSGRLTSEQRREAQEARMIVIEGREEITRFAKQNGLEPFKRFEEQIGEDVSDVEAEQSPRGGGRA